MVAILFATSDSIYKRIPDCDVWDEQRDARHYAGDWPIVAHPPCRAWGTLRHSTGPLLGERELALFAVEQVRRWGGVLEHPYKSTLWKVAKLPALGERDPWGGYTITMPQWWFGHPAEKATLFYIVGCEPHLLPPIPLRLGEAEFVVATSKREGRRPEISKSDRQRTPPLLAAWLCEVARRCKRPK